MPTQKEVQFPGVRCSVCNVEFDLAERLKELGRGKSGRPPTRCKDCYKPPSNVKTRDIEGRRLRDNERKKALRAAGVQKIEPLKQEQAAIAQDMTAAVQMNDLQLARNLVGKMVSHLDRTFHLLAPRDVASAARQISQVVEILSGGEVSKNPYTHVELVVNFGEDADKAS